MQVLQLYAAHALSRSGGGGGSGGSGGDEGSGVVEEVVQRLLAADEGSWDTLLGEAASSEVRSNASPVLQLVLYGESCGETDRTLSGPANPAPAIYFVLHERSYLSRETGICKMRRAISPIYITISSTSYSK